MQLADLISNSSFVRWVREDHPEDRERWERYLEEHPDKTGMVEEARLLVLGLPFRAQPTPAEEIAEGWQRLYEALPESQLPPPARQGRRWLPIAAAALVLIGIGWFLSSNLQPPAWATEQTDYGERRTVVLPDSSEVLLNANSSLRYRKNRHAGRVREVILQGEAFFKVRQQPPRQSFQVRADGMQVWASASEFSLSTRTKQPTVHLLKGQVQLRHDQHTVAYLMQAGETVCYSPRQRLFVLKGRRAEAHCSWRNGHWTFSNTPFREVLQRIENYYGWPAEVRPPELSERRLTAKIAFDEPDVLLPLLGDLLKVDIRKRENQLIIQPK